MCSPDKALSGLCGHAEHPDFTTHHLNLHTARLDAEGYQAAGGPQVQPTTAAAQGICTPQADRGGIAEGFAIQCQALESSAVLQALPLSRHGKLHGQADCQGSCRCVGHLLL